MKNSPYPIDTILDYLSKNQPLITPEWTAWKATMANPKLAGTWAVSAYSAGQRQGVRHSDHSGDSGPG